MASTTSGTWGQYKYYAWDKNSQTGAWLSWANLGSGSSYTGNGSTTYPDAYIGKWTTPSISGEVTGLSLRVAILRIESTWAKTGTLEVYVYTSDPWGTTKPTTTVPSGYVAHGIQVWSSTDQEVHGLDIAMTIDSSITSSTTYYVYIKNDTILSLGYSGYTSSTYWSSTITYVDSYTISYNNGGYTASNMPSSQTKKHGVTLTLSSKTPARNSTSSTSTFTITGNANCTGGTNTSLIVTKTTTTSYPFSNWKATSGISYFPGNSYTANESTTMTAQWSSNTSYSYSDNTLGNLPIPTRSQSTSTVKVTLNANYTGGTNTSESCTATTTHNFLGWNTSSTATTALSSTTAYTATKTVYAIWKSITSKYSSITLPTLSRTGFQFKGWSTSSTGSATLAAGSVYTPTEATTLYAVWEVIPVEMTDGVLLKNLYIGNTYTTAYAYDGNAWKRVLVYIDS